MKSAELNIGDVYAIAFGKSVLRGTVTGFGETRADVIVRLDPVVTVNLQNVISSWAEHVAYIEQAQARQDEIMAAWEARRAERAAAD